MISIACCLLAFIITYALGRRSMVWGLAACIGFGYVFGVIKANLLDTLSFLIWDASVLGFYASYVSTRPSPEELYETRTLRLWVAVLIMWPVLLTIAPVQHPLIQLVGLRTNAFLLPFLLIGARLKSEHLDRLGSILAVFNIGAFIIGLIEYFAGLEMFFPQNEVTQLIYNSRDVAGFSEFRIPAFFINAHAYAGTMVLSIPFLLGACVREPRSMYRKLMWAGMLSALIGVFLSASRTHAIMLFALIGVAMMSGRLRSLSRASLIVIVLLTTWLVSNNDRLQRFTTLLDSEFVSDRISASVNLPFLEAALEYPFGIGMGGGGTSIPYFLQGQIRQPVAAENEYARIMLEEGVLGLFLWFGFLGWVVVRSLRHSNPSLGFKLARFACLGYFAMACLGTGTLASVPQTVLMLLAGGWASSGMEEASSEVAEVSSGMEEEDQIFA